MRKQVDAIDISGIFVRIPVALTLSMFGFWCFILYSQFHNTASLTSTNHGSVLP